MSIIRVISPHVDDAAFSLASTLKVLRSAGCYLRIINCFTVTRFAPYLQTCREEPVSTWRRKEDGSFTGLLGVSKSIELGLLDAPGRTGLGIRGIFMHTSSALQLHETVEAVRERFEEADAGSSVVAPLALGNHTDHYISSEAAIAKYAEYPMAFYEDLPYASGVQPHEIQARLADIAEASGMVLSPLTVSWDGDSEWKERCCSFYASQISRGGINRILEYMKKMKGERLWCSPGFLESWAGKVLSGLSPVSCPSLQ